MKHIHHTTETNKRCALCDRPFLWLWRDAEETNGRSELRWGSPPACYDCHLDRRGEKPLTLHEHNEQRKREANR